MIVTNCGYYKVGETIFSTKPAAFMEWKKRNIKCTYHYYDEIFSSIDRSILGKIPLSTLYRERALQIRESYDYLVLYYSGGSDSRNILNVFLKNKIKLDCIFVAWPMITAKKGIYQPNDRDVDATNFLSEWDFTISKDLKWLATEHPEIRIEVKDWLENPDPDAFSYDAFDQVIHRSFMSTMLRVRCRSDIEAKMVESGKKVAGIYGIEKPLVGLDELNNFFFWITDFAMSLMPPNLKNPTGTEYFYTTPSFPILAWEQAYQVMRWFRSNVKYHYLLQPWMRKNHADPSLKSKKHHAYHLQQEVIKSIIYPDFDRTRFQTDKPISPPKNFLGRAKDFVIESHPEIRDTIKMTWQKRWVDWMEQFDPAFFDDRREPWIMKTNPYIIDRI